MWEGTITVWAVKPPHQFHYVMQEPSQHGESTALKTTNLEGIQSLVDANERTKWMCLSALGTTVFAALWVSSLESRETALLSCRDELNTSQMFEEAKQSWQRHPDISHVEAVIWTGNRVSSKHKRARSVWDGQHLNGVRVSKCVCMHQETFVCVLMCKTDLRFE